jgi:cytochrome c oxidase cbb3-type subunit 3
MSNYLEILMIIVALLLVVVIWSLSSVLAMIAKKVVEQSKQANKVLMILVIASSSLFSNYALGQDPTTSDSTAAAPVINYGGMSSTSFWTMGTVIALELLVVLLLVVFIKGLWKSLHPIAQVATEKKIASSWLVTTWNKLDKQFFTKAAPIEQEADIMLDHDYDGIKELDNALPPWWKYGFYITIVVAVFYILKFEVWKTGQDQIQEYTTEMAEAKLQTEAYLAEMKENVDEKSVVMSDAAGINAGKELFAKTCVACHMSNGEGGVGPNLTDDYWIHGGSINDVFKSMLPQVQMYSNGVILEGTNYSDNRSIRFSLTYNFGNNKVHVEDREIKNEEEISRTKSEEK